MLNKQNSNLRKRHPQTLRSRRECSILGVLFVMFAVNSLAHRAQATPGSAITISAAAQTSSESRLDQQQNEEVKVLSALLTHHHGLTPWGEALFASDRYISAKRDQSIDEEEIVKRASDTGSSELGSDQQILNSFDQYILKRAMRQLDLGSSTGGEVSEYTEYVNPIYEAEVSLSHTWRHSASGYLLNARQMEKSPYWINRRFKNYGTPEMIATIKAGVKELHVRFPKSPKLIIGDLSKRYGGHFPPHLSHQSGRDADIGYFVRGLYAYRLKGLSKVTRRTLDVKRTWAFLSGMLKTGLVESAFIDYQLQKALYRFAKEQGQWPIEKLNKIFSYPRWKGGMISHLRGHSDHMHVRFKAPLSQRRATRYMAENGSRRLRPRRVRTRPKKGESLIKLGRRFRVSWKTLLKWNRLSRAQARRPLKHNRRYIVGYYTPYYARQLKFDTPISSPEELATGTHTK